MIEALKEAYEEWRKERSRKNYRQNWVMKIGVKVLFLNSDEISERERGEDVISDETVHVEEDAILSSEIHDLHAALSQLDPASYEIGGKTFFTMGGAKSHDVEDGILDPADPNFHAQQSALKRSGRNRFRVLGRSWWPEELPSDEEYHTALKTLERTNWQVDYVITHCASTSITLSMNRHNEADHLTEFLEMVDRRLEYEYWFFGHFHDNRSVDQKHILLWEQIVQIL